jgi:DNA-binding NarL/FixJ family response regulator/tetratricopeptide (TPR) repeat protein
VAVSEVVALLGRTRESDAVGAALDGLASGVAGLIAVTGDPGLGKTRMLAEAARLARERGFVVLQGLASRRPARTRLEPLADALHEHWTGLERLRAEAAGPADAYRAVRALLEELANPGLVLLLDDLHRADEGTVDLLVDLLRHPPRGPVLVVLAYRPRQAPIRLRQAVEGPGGPVEQLPLEPLGEAEIRTFLGARDTPGRRRLLHRRSGGYPLYLDGAADCAHEVCTCAGEVPAGLRLTVTAELAELRPRVRAVAWAASVVDGPFGIDLAAELAERDEAEVSAAIDDLVRQDLVRPVEGTAQFAFRHPAVRQAAYDSAEPAWRVAAHSRAALALELRGAPAAALAPHIALAGGAGSPHGVALLVEAARTVRPRDPALAAEWLRTASRLAPDRADLLLALAGALAIAGKPAESREVLHEARGLVHSEEPGSPRRALVLCAQVERLLGRRAEARAMLLRELPGAAGEDPALAFELAAGELADGRLDSGRSWATRALTGARGHRSRTLTASAHGLLALTGSFGGAHGTAAGHADAAAELVDGLIDGEFRLRPDTAVWLGWSELLLDRPQAARRHLDRALAAAHAGGNVLVLPYVQVGRALVLRSIGQLAEAREAADEAIAAARQCAGDEQLALALAARCWVATWAGDRRSALLAGAAATEWRSRPPGPWVAAFARRMSAEARLAAGEPETGLDLLECTGPDLGRADPWSRAEICELLTRAELARGGQDAATRWAGLASAVPGPPGREGFALLAGAQASADPAAALRLASEARSRFEEAGAPMEAVRARFVGGMAAAAGGQGDLAASELRSAQNAFDASGARYWSRRAVAERRRLAGRSPRRAGGAGRQCGVAGLSGRERQVAALVSEGMTNRRIAQRLYVTEKTVEMHLSNIFAKLGASSRVEVARRFTEAEGVLP